MGLLGFMSNIGSNPQAILEDWILVARTFANHQERTSKKSFGVSDDRTRCLRSPGDRADVWMTERFIRLVNLCVSRDGLCLLR